jgi:hypothetical protein
MSQQQIMIPQQVGRDEFDFSFLSQQRLVCAARPLANFDPSCIVSWQGATTRFLSAMMI